MEHMDNGKMQNRMKRRVRTNNFFRYVFLLASLFGLAVLAILLVRIVTQAIGWIDWDFLTGRLSTIPENAGVGGAILGTAWLMLVVIPVTLILGVGSAIYLELYAKQGKFKNIIQTNISNLAGVPSIVYGLLGLTVFVRLMGMGNVVLAGGLTLALLVMPILIVSAQEALRAVPNHLTEASYAMGATKWQTVRRVVLPAALPSILTGTILAISRAIGETAPLTTLGIPALLIPFPSGLFDTFTALPIQIYYWTLDSVLTEEYMYLAAATIVVLLALLFLLNGIAALIRNKFQRDL